MSDDYVTVGWVKDHLQRLQRDADDIWGVQPDVANVFKEWSPLKLIVLAGVVELYTRIIPNNFENMYYIDLMAGSGSVEIPRDDGDTERFVGSPVLAAALSRAPFEHMYLIEKNEDRADALDKRMAYAAEELDYGIKPDQYTVIEKDANTAIPEIIDHLQVQVRKTESVHSLVFADNEGADLNWKTIKKLTSVYSDLLINFPASNVRRLTKNPTTLHEFYGDNRWRGAGTDTGELRGIYKGNLANIGRPIQDKVRVRGAKNYFYDLIYATRETQGGNPFMDAFKHLRENIEPLHGDDVDLVIRYMRGEETNFEPFPGPDPTQVSIFDY